MMQLDNVLRNATQAVEQTYFQLKLAGAPHTIFRERVYCYELYHQMRLQWPRDCGYVLNGEVDKAGHQLLRRLGLDRLKPDFLVHTPGCMEGNHTVIEVKPASVSDSKLLLAVASILKFLTNAGYQRGILLVYGDLGNERMRRIVELINSHPGSDAVEFWHHQTVGTPAARVCRNMHQN
jgi:hypothetical protein